MPFDPVAVPPAGDEIIEVMGLKLNNLHRDVIAERVAAAVLARRKMLVVNANASLIVLAQNNPWLGRMFAKADIAFCDGAGVQLAIRILTGRAAHRTTPPEWIGPVMEAVGARGAVFWLGGNAGVVEEAARRYEARYGVRIAGTQHGFFDMSKNSPGTLALVERINRAKPSILLVNMGMPRQERWLWENWDRLDPVVAITAGALVDHAAGLVHRPPRWVANLGVEWLVRLVREPRRLWRRYLLGLPVFGAYVLRYAVSGPKNLDG
jgi:N-acetylglucosaminyldiphosphoundecaprenol N-acetyl-beta-D-mannosaminyltransferase